MIAVELLAHPAPTAFKVVDSFTTQRAFSGNPAGVVLLEAFPDDAWMQGVANELHQAETAFLVPEEKGIHSLRWFTPVAEVALCGHATLASAHVLWEIGALRKDAVAGFDTRSGRLTAELHGDRIVLDFPAVPALELETSEVMVTALSDALAGATVVWAGLTEDDDPNERNLLAVLESEQVVRDLVPDLQAIAALPAGGLIVTARGPRPSSVVSRYFAPIFGIPEDPVTGSAHCTIGPYWRDQLGSRLDAEQASARGGHLTVVTTKTGRVRLGGAARTAVTGHLH